MPRPSFNKTNRISLSMTPETKARLEEYAMERQLSISNLVAEWIWGIRLKSDEKPKETGAAAEG